MPSSRLFFAIALLASLPARAQDAGAVPADIHAFDFRNFLYSSLHGVRIRLRDGHWRLPPGDATINGEWLAIDDVVYGDLTGDGRDEAVVWLNECTGGTGQFSYANVYVPAAATPERIGRVSIGDRADGGIAAVRITNGHLEVDRFGHDHGGAMDEEWIETETWSVGPAGLHLDATGDRHAWLDHLSGVRPQRITFLPRTSRAVLVGTVTPTQGDRWPLRTRPGRALTIDFPPEHRWTAEGLRVDVTARDGTTLGTVTAGGHARVSLPGGGAFTLVVTSPTPTSYRVDVALIEEAPTP